MTGARRDGRRAAFVRAWRRVSDAAMARLASRRAGVPVGRLAAFEAAVRDADAGAAATLPGGRGTGAVYRDALGAAIQVGGGRAVRPPLHVEIVGSDAAARLRADGRARGWHMTTARGARDPSRARRPSASPDVTLVTDPAVDARYLPTAAIRVAWITRDPDSWIGSDGLEEFDIVLAGTDEIRERIAVVRPAVQVVDPSGAAASDELVAALARWLEATRIGIRIGASNWPNARSWGDYHFGRSLQRAFERLGHPTRVRLLRDWDSPSAARDDVTVHLFGLTPARNRPGQLNVLWQISHPELASPELYREYDIRFAASIPFAARMANEAGVDVIPLLQATDPDRFRPVAGGRPSELLYVANHREGRPALDWLLPTERDLAVVGRGWAEAGIPARHLRGEHVANEDLAAEYAAAGIVINDTWEAMRAEGFISNRVLDALASGAFVISDDIAGIDDVFAGSVPVYRDRAGLRELVDRFADDAAARSELARRGRDIVLAHHTFAHRAAAILEAVDAHLAVRSR